MSMTCLECGAKLDGNGLAGYCSDACRTLGEERQHRRDLAEAETHRRLGEGAAPGATGVTTAAPASPARRYQDDADKLRALAGAVASIMADAQREIVAREIEQDEARAELARVQAENVELRRERDAARMDKHLDAVMMEGAK